MTCPHNDAACGTYYDCDKCLRKKRERIWANMTPEQRNYDRMVDPQGAHTSGLSAPGGDRFLYEDREPSGCSCHISPPCNYCIEKSEEQQ